MVDPLVEAVGSSSDTGIELLHHLILQRKNSGKTFDPAMPRVSTYPKLPELFPKSPDP